MNRTLIGAIGLTAVLAPVAAQADAISINVLNATYSANLSFQLNGGGGTTTATASGSSAVIESLTMHDPYSIIDPNDGSVLYSGEYVSNAFGTADWLAVSETIHPDGTNHWSGQAVADFDLTFSPVADGTALPGIAYTRSGEYGSGFGSLFDVTTGQYVWSLYFGSDFGGSDLGPVFVDYPGGGVLSSPVFTGCTVFVNGAYEDVGCGPFVMPTALTATDVYDLHLTASSFNPGFGGTFSSVQVSGLVPVPEPASVLLLGTGLGTLGLLRRRFSGPQRHRSTEN